MTPERREQIQERFDRLAKLAPDEAARELEALGAQDPQLRREVEALLKGTRRSSRSLEEILSGGTEQPVAVSEQRVDRIGQTISHYHIEERLGGGGMGVVYKAHDMRLDRYVALKFLPPAADDDDERLKRLIVEARAASALDHPNICTIHQIDQTNDGHWFIVMAYYHGETVKRRIERQPMSVDEVLDFGIQISQGLVKAHKEGIVHRDLKPANLMVTGDGVIKIVDFGLAQLVAQTKLTAPGTRLGTPAYMSPEQAQGQPLDHRTDIWSLGIVLYEMLAGRSPFKGEYELAVIYSIVNEEPAPLEELRADAPSELVRLVKKALSKDPADRYPQVEDLLRELEALKAARTTLHGMGPVSAPVSAPPAQVQAAGRGRGRFVYVGLAAAVAVVIAVILTFLLREPASPPSVSPPIATTQQPDATDDAAATEPDSFVSEETLPEPEAEASAAPPPAPAPAAGAPKTEPVAEERPAARAAAPVRSWPPPSRRWALIVGVEQYADDGITPFRGAARDAAELAEALVRYAGFPFDQVTALVSGDSALRAPTRVNVENYLQSVTRLVQPEDLFLFCYIGHAAMVNGQPVLLPVDARPSGNSVAANSAVRLEAVRQAIRNRGIRQAVLLFDGFRQNPRQQGANAMSARYASALSFGAAPREVDAFAAFYAASSGERAYEHASDGGGYFASVFVEGLKGAAADGRGRVTLGALDRYLHDVVPKRVMGDLGASAVQRPFSEIAGYVRDEVVIATVARRELTQTEPATQQQARPVDTAAQELVEWTRIRNSDDIGAFEGFLRHYPNGSLRQEAQARIDELKWQAARANNGAAAIERFLEENPNSRYVAQAQARLKELQPPPPAPQPAPAPVAKVEAPPAPNEGDAIREVLRRYGAAYKAKDVDEVAALWPSLTQDQLRRIAGSFRIAVSIQQELMPLAEPVIQGNQATVRCRRLARYEDERGPQRPVDEQVTVTLAKQRGSWVIQAVN